VALDQGAETLTETGTSVVKQWKLLIDPGEPDGWYPPGSSDSVPPSEHSLHGGAGNSVGSTTVRLPDRSIPTGPVSLRGFYECADGVVAAADASTEDDTAALNLASRVDRACNALRREDPHVLLQRE